MTNKKKASKGKTQNRSKGAKKKASEAPQDTSNEAPAAELRPMSVAAEPATAPYKDEIEEVEITDKKRVINFEDQFDIFHEAEEALAQACYRFLTRHWERECTGRYAQAVTLELNQDTQTKIFNKFKHEQTKFNLDISPGNEKEAKKAVYDLLHEMCMTRNYYAHKQHLEVALINANLLSAEKVALLFGDEVCRRQLWRLRREVAVLSKDSKSERTRLRENIRTLRETHSDIYKPTRPLWEELPLVTGDDDSVGTITKTPPRHP